MWDRFVCSTKSCRSSEALKTSIDSLILTQMTKAGFVNKSKGKQRPFSTHRNQFLRFLVYFGDKKVNFINILVK